MRWLMQRIYPNWEADIESDEQRGFQVTLVNTPLA
jgi:hypothetical protein